MYRTAIQTMIRRNVDQLNRGNTSLSSRRRMLTPSWSFPVTTHGHVSSVRREAPSGARHAPRCRRARGVRPTVRRGRPAHRHLRHPREGAALEDTHLRPSVRGTVDSSGADVYNNRVVFIEACWGKIRRWEDHLDAERVSDWDRAVGADGRPTEAAGRWTVARAREAIRRCRHRSTDISRVGGGLFCAIEGAFLLARTTRDTTPIRIDGGTAEAAEATAVLLAGRRRSATVDQLR